MHRKDFPILKKTVFLDSAACMLKPKKVVQAISDFYLKYPLNPHSIDSPLGTKVGKKVEETRKNVANLINCSSREVIFTSGTTDSLNKISLMLEHFLDKKAEIVLSPFNHSSNLIPWIKRAERKKAKIVYSENILDQINSKTKIVAFSQMNNTLNIKLDLQAIYKKAKKVNAIVINDAAQAVSHQKVSLKYSDVVVFSGNKLYGPTGIGVLVVKEELLNKLTPVTFGGGSVSNVKNGEVFLKTNIDKFESGTLNTSGIIGLNESINYFDLSKTQKYEKILANYAYEKLKAIPKIKLYSKKGDLILLFNVENFHSHDVVSFLGKENIIVRSGNHCVNIDPKDAFLKKNIRLFLPASIRVSLAFYNNKKDIDLLCSKIENNRNFIV